MKVSRTRDWRPAVPVFMMLVVLGMAFGSMLFLVTSIIPLLFILYSSFSRIPEDPVEVRREVRPSTPLPGDEVEVVLEVENVSDSSLTDVRVVDGVPERLGVKSGSPRIFTSLRSGETKQTSYVLTAKRGRESFLPVNIKIGTINSSLEGQDLVYAEGDSDIICRIDLEDAPLRSKTKEKAGDITTDKGGSGIEFHSLRDYRPSDPLRQVEWRHFAKTGELATVNFREQRSAEIMLVVDNRKVSEFRSSENSPSGRKLCFYAARRVFDFLEESRHDVGLTGLGMEYDDSFVASSRSGIPVMKTTENISDRDVKEFFSTADKDALQGESGSFYAERLHKFLNPSTQVVVFSPLMDDEVEPITRTLNMYGHPVTVVSPDITGGSSLGSDMEKLERDLRVAEIKKRAEVIDWDDSEALSITVSKAMEQIGGNIGG